MAVDAPCPIYNHESVNFDHCRALSAVKSPTSVALASDEKGNLSMTLTAGTDRQKYTQSYYLEKAGCIPAESKP